MYYENIRNAIEIFFYFRYTSMNKSMFPGNKGFLLRCIDTANDVLNLNYIYVDLHCRSQLPRQYQVFTGMFLSDNLPPGVQSPVFFYANS